MSTERRWPQWVDFGKEKPPHYEEVLISSSEGLATAYYDEDTGSFWLTPYQGPGADPSVTLVSHWMPLPDEPELAN